MRKPNALNCIDILESYIKGKDQDQYKILESIYSENAELTFQIASDNISFPASVSGNLEIARVLSKDFNKQYRNVKTYYLTRPHKDQFEIHQQKWLVVMQDGFNKDENDEIQSSTRVGCGYYDWDLINLENDLKIIKHKIHIHSMLQFQDDQEDELKRIQSALPYPWVDLPKVIETLKVNSQFADIVEYL